MLLRKRSGFCCHSVVTCGRHPFLDLVIWGLPKLALRSALPGACEGQHCIDWQVGMWMDSAEIDFGGFPLDTLLLDGDGDFSARTRKSICSKVKTVWGTLVIVANLPETKIAIDCSLLPS